VRQWAADPAEQRRRKKEKRKDSFYGQMHFLRNASARFF